MNILNAEDLEKCFYTLESEKKIFPQDEVRHTLGPLLVLMCEKIMELELLEKDNK